MPRISAFIDWNAWRENKSTINLIANFDAYTAYQKLSELEISELLSFVDHFRKGCRFIEDIEN